MVAARGVGDVSLVLEGHEMDEACGLQKEGGPLSARAGPKDTERTG